MISDDELNLINYLPDSEIKAFEARRLWLEKARDIGHGGKQLPPLDDDWEILLFIAGRGFGKTIAQIQWAWWEAWRVPNLIVHAIAPTLSDVRGTTFEGPAGFNSTIPAECLLHGAIEKAYNKTAHELRLSNGSLIRGFGAVEEANRLRGPQCHILVADELREWDRPSGNLRDAMNNALFGLRLPYPDGTPSRAVMGTTPKPIPYLKRFEKDPRVRVVRGTSHENVANLSASYRSQLLSLAGTALGRQEIDAAYIDEESDLSILKRNWIRLWPVDQRTKRHRPLPVLSYIIESYDTASSEHNYDKKKQETDPTASIVLGVFNIEQNFTELERRKMGLRAKYGVLLLDCWSERLGLPELLERAQKQARKKWGPAERARHSDRILIEDKSSGPGVRQMLAKWNVHAWPIKPRGNKAMRFHGISPLVQQGALWVPESMRDDRVGQTIAWAEEFMDQICGFAGEGSVEHDDYVDCVSQALIYLRDESMIKATPEQRFLDLEEKEEYDKAQAVRQYDESRRHVRSAPYG